VAVIPEHFALKARCFWWQMLNGRHRKCICWSITDHGRQASTKRNPRIDGNRWRCPRQGQPESFVLASLQVDSSPAGSVPSESDSRKDRVPPFGV